MYHRRWPTLSVLICQEDEVVHVSHLPNHKSPSRDGLMNEFFKKYVLQLKCVTVFLFRKVWLIRHMPPLRGLV
jgi:hypothetical protein